MPATDRARWIAFRSDRQGLTSPERPDGTAHGLLLRLGIQDSPEGAAIEALAARGDARAPSDTAPTEPDDLVVVWSVRGAPHAHRVQDLERVRAAQQVVDDDDADTRMAGWQKRVDGHVTPSRMLADVTAAMEDIVTGPTTKGELSTEVSRRLPDETFWCASCQAQHVPDITFRLAALQARLTVVRTNPTVLAPWPDSARSGEPDAAEARAGLAREFLRAQGATSLALFTTWLGAGRHAMDAAWADLDMEAQPVTVDGRPYSALTDDLDALLSAEAAARGWAALVPGRDPYLHGADKHLLVPDPADRKRVWRPVRWPGVLLIDGNVSGTWRHRTRGAGLDVIVTPFGRAAKAALPQIAVAAKRLAVVRGLESADVEFN
jgi:hypothetical protein